MKLDYGGSSLLRSHLLMAQLTGKEIPHRSPHILSHKTKKGLALMDLENGQVVYNVTGYCVQIWQAIDGKKNLSDITQDTFKECQVLDKYLERYQSDVTSFMDRLIELKLIHF